MSLTKTTLTGNAVAGLPGEVHATQLNAVLTEAEDHAGQKFVYLAGVASTIVGAVVTFDEAGITTLIAANAIGRVAVATAIVDAATKWGWYLIKGSKSTSCDATIADNAKVYIDGTAGRVDDAVVAGDQIMGAIFRGTDTSNFVLVEYDRPFVCDSLG